MYACIVTIVGLELQTYKNSLLSTNIWFLDKNFKFKDKLIVW